MLLRRAILRPRLLFHVKPLLLTIPRRNFSLSNKYDTTDLKNAFTKLAKQVQADVVATKNTIVQDPELKKFIGGLKQDFKNFNNAVQKQFFDFESQQPQDQQQQTIKLTPDIIVDNLIKDIKLMYERDQKVTLTLVLDVSQSMKLEIDKNIIEPDQARIHYIKECAKKLISATPQDSLVNIVSFASLHYKLKRGVPKREAHNIIDSISPTDDPDTYVGAYLKAVCRTKLAPDNHKSVVILLTDGEENNSDMISFHRYDQTAIKEHVNNNGCLVKVLSIYKNYELEQSCKQAHIDYITLDTA